jgi:hypothetical protein
MLAKGVVGTNKWYTFPAISSADFVTPIYGMTDVDFTCHYYYGGAYFLEEVTLGENQIRAAGEGGYSILIGENEFTQVGNLEIIIQAVGMVTYRLPVYVEATSSTLNVNVVSIDDNVITADKIASNAITADKVATGAIKDGAIASAERDNIAKSIFNLDLSSFVGEAARSLKNAIRFLRNKWSISGTTLTVTKEDDVTAAWTATITPSAGSAPTVGVDPN